MYGVACADSSHVGLSLVEVDRCVVLSLALLLTLAFLPVPSFPSFAAHVYPFHTSTTL
jgi:hypothetical protein